MFREPDSCDYKVACKYDSMLELNEINHRVSKACVTRHSEQLELQDMEQKKSRKEMLSVENLPSWEKRNEQLWQRLTVNLLTVPEENAKDFFKKKLLPMEQQSF